MIEKYVLLHKINSVNIPAKALLSPGNEKCFKINKVSLRRLNYPKLHSLAHLLSYEYFLSILKDLKILFSLHVLTDVL